MTLIGLSNDNSVGRIGAGGRIGSGRRMGGLEKFGAFTLSALESFPELFGIEPSRATMEFRAANPVSGFASQAVGAFVPYLGAAKLARLAPVTGRFIRGAEALGRGSVSRMALGAGAEAVVVEAGRLGLSATGLPEAIYEAGTGRQATMRGFDDLLGEAAFNIGGSAVVGAGFGALAGRFARKTPFANIPGLEETAPDRPMPQRIRAFNDWIKRAQDPQDSLSPAPEILERVARERDNLMRMNREGAVPTISDNGVSVRSGTYRRDLGRVFRPIVGEKKARKGGRYGELSNFLHRASNWRSKGDLTRTRRLILDPLSGYTTEKELAETLAGAGTTLEELSMEATDFFTLTVKSGVGRRAGEAAPLPESPMPSMAPEQAAGRRLLSSPVDYRDAGTKDPNLARARSVQRRLQDNRLAQKIGDGWNLYREGDDGLYVMTKKVRGGLDPSPGDEWLVVRTDNPGAFQPKAKALQDRMLASGYFPEPPEAINANVGIWDADNAFKSLADKGIDLQPKKAPPAGRVGAVANELLELAGDKLAPSAPGAARHPLANATFQRLKNLEAFVEDRVDTLMRGSRFLDETKSMGRQILSFKEVASEGFDEMAKALPKEGLEDIRAVLEMEIPAEALPDMLSRGLLDEGAFNYLMALQRYSDTWVDDLGKLNKIVTGESASTLIGNFQARKGHYIFTREYPGAYRQFLVDDAGEIRGVATGKSPMDAAERAKEIIEDSKKKGLDLFEGPFVDEALKDSDQIAKFKRAVLRPGFLKNRGDLLGYELQGKELTGKDLSRLTERNLKRRENFLRDIVIVEKFAGDLAKLERDAPNMATFIRKRIALLNGDEGDFGRAQNQIMDKALAVVGLSGKDSASAIVRETQKVLSDFQFGFANLVNPLQNLLGIFQTVLPEVSFASRISPESAANYVSLPVYDSANNLTGSINMLSDVKLFYNAMKNAAKPFGKLDQEHQELIYQMMRERYLAPRFAEEQFGTNGALLANPKQAFESTESFIEFFGAANRVLVTKSEEFNRMVALNAAYEVAKMRGMSQAQMTVFTREFLSKTAFNYGTVDRATVFTTPIGSLLGTFKNWMFHYTANMIKYATGGQASRAAFFWQTGATAVLGGAAATPFIVPLADGASKFLTNEPLIQSLYEAIGTENEWIGDGILYGLPGALGLSFASQIASPGADPERDASMMFSLAMSDRMRSLGGGVKDAITAYAATGESPFTDANVRDQLVRALAPRSIYRAMAAGENGAIRSMATGYDVARLGPGSAALYALGFNPTELEKTYAVYDKVRSSQQRKRTLTQEFGRTLAQAWESGDQALANRVFARAMATGVDTSSVLRSAKARMERGQQTQLEFTASPEDQIDYSYMFE